MDVKHGDYVKMLGKNRTKYQDPKDFQDLPMDCKLIKSRNFFSPVPTTSLEANYPLAFVRTVYTDYRYIELMLAAGYQPQNYYCYAIDQKSSDMFKMRIQAMANCFPNVFVLNRTRKLDSWGHNQDWAHLDCIKMLREKGRKWKYVQILQNHEFPLKTNFEMVQIYKWMKGANDIESVKEPGRVNYKLNWTYPNLGIFKNESRLHQLNNYTKIRMTFAKGANGASLSREAIDYIFTELNITKLVSMIDDGKSFAVDEVLIPSLISNEDLGIPGHFTQKCHGKSDSQTLTRMSSWKYVGTKCGSKHFRHSLCIYGVEDIATNLGNSVFINGNKMLNSFDFNAVVCWMEVLYNRTFVNPPTIKRLKKKEYDNWLTVRYQDYKLKTFNSSVITKQQSKNFTCKIK
ncbi:unnamed protein product [Bursaphelenchus okinawaensis]|uniref:Uncharacterized protein n=1 Tax=Bursaphelenchus okinawaensis TaxID=465554 RepID=A0A811L7D3_9BILA|nr:unnamed protein product [Bursaphelenchus okinawaensis]CAG9117888.1 unnamed protein product [Bursaphelenchus okinawaensis]